MLKKSADNITKEDVLAAQQAWADGLVDIGRAYVDDEDYTARAAAHVDALYAYGQEGVVFKPTKAKEHPFRNTREEAISYFVGGCVEEDKGFALAPWVSIAFANDQIVLDGTTAYVGGVYTFTDAKGSQVTVEYTFVYKKQADGNPRIVGHHSSLPYSG